MQGNRNAVGSVADSINFDYGSTSSNVGVDQQISWNSFLEPVDRDGINESRWIFGESSSTNLQSMINHDERTVHNGWSSSTTSLGSDPRIEAQRHELPIITPRNRLNLNLSMNQIASESNLGQLGQVGCGSSEPFGSTSRTVGFSVEEDEGRSGFALEGRRLPCKRKTTEGNPGQSSNGGSTWPVNPAYGHLDSSLSNTRLELGMGAVSPYVNDSSRRNSCTRPNPGNTLLPIDPPQGLVAPNGRHDSALHGQPLVAPLPQLQGSIQRAQWSTSSASLVSEPRDLNSRHVFMPSGEVRGNAAQLPTNWSLSSGGLDAGSRAGPNLGSHSMPRPSVGSSRRHSPSQYMSRLSDHVRRSPSIGGRSGSSSASHSIASSSNLVGLPSGGSGAQRLIQSLSRSALWRDGHGDGVSGAPRSLRSLPARVEGRSRLVSEHIRNVLDIMRRGEVLRFEDVMVLDPSVFFSMADIHDQHRDMRLDVDNMSYEELLALEERIGDVCTGVSAETIVARMRQRKFSSVTSNDQNEIEPCCICQEEFNEGEDLGTLDCGHDFHSECIKRWLGQKNLCPICKTTALST